MPARAQEDYHYCALKFLCLVPAHDLLAGYARVRAPETSPEEFFGAVRPLKPVQERLTACAISKLYLRQEIHNTIRAFS
jgi:hypothetical protein